MPYWCLPVNRPLFEAPGIPPQCEMKERIVSISGKYPAIPIQRGRDFLIFSSPVVKKGKRCT